MHVKETLPGRVEQLVFDITIWACIVAFAAIGFMWPKARPIERRAAPACPPARARIWPERTCGAPT